LIYKNEESTHSFSEEPSDEEEDARVLKIEKIPFLFQVQADSYRISTEEEEEDDDHPVCTNCKEMEDRALFSRNLRTFKGGEKVFKQKAPWGKGRVLLGYEFTVLSKCFCPLTGHTLSIVVGREGEPSYSLTPEFFEGWSNNEDIARYSTYHETQ